MAILEIKNLTKYFGALAAVYDVSFSLQPGRIIGLIGPNGAGKTTLFNLISGFEKLDRGKILLQDNDVTKLSPSQRVHRGIVRTFQENKVFKNQTTLENVMRAAFSSISQSGLLKFLVKTSGTLNAEENIREKSLLILKRLGINGVANKLAGELPHGSLRKLGVAMAYILEPKVMLLDEPLTGLDPLDALELLQTVRSFLTEQRAVILVDHNMKLVLDICDKIIVLDFGKMIADDIPENIVKNREVMRAYMGI